MSSDDMETDNHTDQIPPDTDTGGTPSAVNIEGERSLAGETVPNMDGQNQAPVGSNTGTATPNMNSQEPPQGSDGVVDKGGKDQAKDHSDKPGVKNTPHPSAAGPQSTDHSPGNSVNSKENQERSNADATSHNTHHSEESQANQSETKTPDDPSSDSSPNPLEDVDPDDDETGCPNYEKFYKEPFSLSAIPFSKKSAVAYHSLLEVIHTSLKLEVNNPDNGEPMSKVIETYIEKLLVELEEDDMVEKLQKKEELGKPLARHWNWQEFMSVPCKEYLNKAFYTQHIKAHLSDEAAAQAETVIDILGKGSFEDILLDTFLDSCVDEASNMPSQDAITAEAIREFDRKVTQQSGQYDKIKRYHVSAAKYLRELCQFVHKHPNVIAEGKDLTISESDRAILSQLKKIKQNLREINTRITIENTKDGAPYTLGHIEIDVLESWYRLSDDLSNDATLKAASAVYQQWSGSQIPIGFLRKKAEQPPAFAGAYPRREQIVLYLKAIFGWDGVSRTKISAEDKAEVSKRLQSTEFLKDFIARIYEDAFVEKVRVQPMRAFANDVTKIHKQKTRHGIHVVSYGISTSSFEPGVTIFGGTIVATQHKQLDNARSRLYMVSTNTGVFQMFNENEVGGQVIFEKCKGLPNVYDILDQKDKSFPKKEVFQKHDWAVTHVATRRAINSPSRGQPPVFVMVYYRATKNGERLQLAMSRASLIFLTNKSLADAFITGCITNPQEEIPANLSRALVRQNPELVIESDVVVKSSDSMVLPIRTSTPQAPSASQEPGVARQSSAQRSAVAA